MDLLYFGDTLPWLSNKIKQKTVVHFISKLRQKLNLFFVQIRFLFKNWPNKNVLMTRLGYELHIIFRKLL